VKITTWNVNSLTARMQRAENWLRANPVDVLCLQELKMEDAKFPHAMFESLGYRAEAFGQKTYNGVAIISKNELPPPANVLRGIPEFDDIQSRVIAATIGDVRIVCLYVVNGQEVGSEKFAYKLRWLEACTNWLERERANHEKLVVVGDFNIAPTDADVHDPKAWEGQVLCTPEERGYFQRWVDMGLADTFRKFDQPPKTFSWWDYRMLAFPKNNGMRIDHVLASEPMLHACTECVIDRNERKGDKPSDHAPVTATFAL
jgi:exodeoxyribonuclease III